MKGLDGSRPPSLAKTPRFSAQENISTLLPFGAFNQAPLLRNNHLVHVLVLVDSLVGQAEVELHHCWGLGCGKTPAATGREEDMRINVSRLHEGGEPNIKLAYIHNNSGLARILALHNRYVEVGKVVHYRCFPYMQTQK